MVSILADTAVRADDINEAAAAEAMKEAEQAIANQTGEIEYPRRRPLAEASAQLKTLDQLRKKLGGQQPLQLKEVAMLPFFCICKPSADPHDM